MKLNLHRPLVFIDLESTGLSITKDRIVELSALKVMPDASEEVINQRFNPEMPIPEVVQKIHGISDADVANEPTFKSFAPKLKQFLKDCDLGGYNSNHYDIPLLTEEFLRAEIDIDFRNSKMIDVQVIYHKKEPRDLKAAYKYYCEQELVNAHSAEADVRATYEIFKAQLDTYDDLKNDISFLHKFTSRNFKMVDHANRIVRNDDGVELFNFGKHKGRPVEEVLQQEKGFYNWMMKGDFPAFTKKIVTEIKLRALKKD